MLKELFPRECDQLAAEQEGLKLRLMIRMMCAYLLFSVMAGWPTTAPQRMNCPAGLNITCKSMDCCFNAPNKKAADNAAAFSDAMIANQP